MNFFGMFIQFVLGLLVTVILCYQVPQFPSLWVGWALFVLMTWMLLFIALHKTHYVYFIKRTQNNIQSLLLPSAKNRLFYLLLSVIIGMNLVFWQAFFSPKIPEESVNHKNVLDIKVLTLPEVNQSDHFTKISFEASLAKIQLKRTQSSLFNTKQFQISLCSQDRACQAWYFNPPKIKVSWYLDHAEYARLVKQSARPQVGQTWQLYAKLKSNHASMNLAGRDYEAWLFQNHILAKATVSGLVVKHKSNQSHAEKIPNLTAIKLKEASMFNWRVWRANTVLYVNNLFKESSFKGIYSGLLVGDKSLIDTQQWALFQQTGTIHLMAISGLHMSIVALLGYLFFRLVWKSVLYRYQNVTLPTFGAVGGLVFATLYLFISGASIPTQRAWIMVATVLAFLLIRRQFQPWSALAMAALAVVVWDSRSVLSTGFWLSFLAVSFIFIALKLYHDRPNWQKLVAMQIMLTAGLAPFILFSFYQVPLYGLLANLIAVPFVTIIGLPGLMLVVASSLFSTELANNLREIMDWFWQQLWDYLAEIAKLSNLTSYNDTFHLVTSQHSVLWLIIVSGFLWLFILFFKYYQTTIQTKILYSRFYFLLLMIGYFLLVALYPYSPPRPLMELTSNHKNQNYQAWLTVLDVGQGQAIVIETANHVVVYDTGATWGLHTDAAKVALIPYLKAQGWSKIDLLMVSHSDIDHAGGTPSVYQAFKIVQAVSGQPKEVNQRLSHKLNLFTTKPIKETSALSKVNLSKQPKFTQCYAGQKWQFDGITFEVLSPFKKAKSALKTDNDLSCVLKVSNQHQAWLITGDLSKKGEAFLIKKYPKQTFILRANLLVAGHHGSKTSTSQAWLDAVHPSKMVFSSGYLNRYQFPAKEVVKRVENWRGLTSISWWNTACSGGLSFKMDKSTTVLRYEARKKQRKWYHHSCLPSEQGTYFQ
ncbi:DNA internalization-related competence protein ComEC/Rec2 [Thiomicrorhabdus hydrogeniphila]